MKLTDKQQMLLGWALDPFGALHGGRNGWPTNWLRALSKKGLLKMDSEATWDSNWSLTDTGREVATAYNELKTFMQDNEA